MSRRAGRSGASCARGGLVSVDSSWFDLARGRWGAGPRPMEGRGMFVVPDGFVSVDGALLPVEPR